jgi:hypothetical protein
LEVFKSTYLANFNNKNRVKNSESLSYKDLISPIINFKDMRFKEQFNNKGPWDNIMNSIANTAKGILSLKKLSFDFYFFPFKN